MLRNSVSSHYKLYSKGSVYLTKNGQLCSNVSINNGRATSYMCFSTRANEGTENHVCPTNKNGHSKLDLYYQKCIGTNNYQRLQQLLWGAGDTNHTSSQASENISHRLRLCTVAAAASMSIPDIPANATEPSAVLTSATQPKVISASNAESSDIIIEPIPEPPPIPDQLAELAGKLNELGEPTFESMGLGGWSPIGMIQNCLEFAHVTWGLPWWQTVVLGTVIVRCILFPLVVISQRNSAKMTNMLPQLQDRQLKLTEARQSGNHYEIAKASQDLYAFMQEKNINPLKTMVVPLGMMPFFLSFFIGLRRMANLPVDSLRTGGTMWFTDLTVPDEYYLLPLLTSLTLAATIELGTDGAKLSAQNMQVMKYIFRALPIVIFPFTMNFPGVIVLYWLSTNTVSLVQVGIMKIPRIRKFLKIDPTVTHDPNVLPIKSKGFVGSIKDSWSNLKLSKQLEDRRKFDDIQFRRAGHGAVQKTYKYDPTQQQSNPNAISAKKR